MFSSSPSVLGHILTTQRLVFDVSWQQLEEAVRFGDVVSDSLQFDLQPLPRHLWFPDDGQSLATGLVITEDSFFRQGNRGSAPWGGFPATHIVFCRCSHIGMRATACIADPRREVVVVLDGITLTLRSSRWEWEKFCIELTYCRGFAEDCHGCPDCDPDPWPFFEEA